LANQNNLCDDDDYIRFFYHNWVECIEVIMRQPTFRQPMSYAATKELNKAERHIYSKATRSDWWWNNQEHQMNSVIAAMIAAT
jgi:hypothetical protein